MSEHYKVSIGGTTPTFLLCILFLMFFSRGCKSGKEASLYDHYLRAAYGYTVEGVEYDQK